MAETGFTRSPKIAKGALVQLLTDVIGIIPNIIVFQYNPETSAGRSRPGTRSPSTRRSAAARRPTVQPFDVQESFSNFRLELDATDDLEDGNPIAAPPASRPGSRHCAS